MKSQVKYNGRMRKVYRGSRGGYYVISAGKKVYLKTAKKTTAKKTSAKKTSAKKTTAKKTTAAKRKIGSKKKSKKKSNFRKFKLFGGTKSTNKMFGGVKLSVEEQAALDAQLWEAAAGGDAAAVVRLAGEGASADAKDEPSGWPAVVWAAHKGHTEVVEALLRLGCDPNASDEGDSTALMEAAQKGHGGVVEALVKHGGAELDAMDDHGWTALMWTAEYGHAAVATQLVEAGADATLRATGGGHQGKTALEIAQTSKVYGIGYKLTDAKKDLAQMKADMSNRVLWRHLRRPAAKIKEIAQLEEQVRKVQEVEVLLSTAADAREQGEAQATAEPGKRPALFTDMIMMSKYCGLYLIIHDDDMTTVLHSIPIPYELLFDTLRLNQHFFKKHSDKNIKWMGKHMNADQLQIFINDYKSTHQNSARSPRFKEQLRIGDYLHSKPDCSESRPRTSTISKVNKEYCSYCRYAMCPKCVTLDTYPLQRSPGAWVRGRWAENEEAKVCEACIAFLSSIDETDIKYYKTNLTYKTENVIISENKGRLKQSEDIIDRDQTVRDWVKMRTPKRAKKANS